MISKPVHLAMVGAICRTISVLMVLTSAYASYAFADPAQTAVQASGAIVRSTFGFCTARHGYDPIISRISGVFESDNSTSTSDIRDQFRNYIGYESDVKYECDYFQTEGEAKEQRQKFFNNPGWVMTPVDWMPSSAKPSSPQTAIKTISLDFQPGDRSGQGSAYRGYRSASIKLNYRFLLCANEIQIAYSLDRKSLEHSQDYVDRFEGINPKYVVPSSEPRVPDTIPLEVKIKYGSPPRTIATLEDGTTGEALGMGCFSGQTRKIGLVGALVGPKATMPQIKAYLDQLAVDLMYVTWDFGYPLLNPDVPVPPGAAPLGAKPRKARPASSASAPAPVESATDSAREAAALNARTAQDAAALTAKTVAAAAAQRQAVADNAASKARFEAEMAAYRRKLAEADRTAREYEAKMVNYRACTAGDKTACARVTAGQ